MIPTQDTNIVAEGQALVTSHYQSAPVIQGIIKSLLQRLQEIENSYWSFINAVQLVNHPMAGGPWSVLDQIGAIVGGVAAQRLGLDDADYLAVIKLQARVNRSRGLSDDVIELASLMLNGGVPVYVDQPPAAFYLGAWNIALNYPLFYPLLAQIRPAGVYGHFHYSTWADGNDFEWGSRYDSTAGQGTWGSRYDATAGSVLVAGVAL